jgi:ribosomal protein S12 methylthiotransferase accessory factor
LDPAALLPAAESEARRLGAVRPSDLTGLDHLGTPCWQVVRPDALDIAGNVTVLTGKGWTPERARLGASMEFLERHWAERSAVPVVTARPSDFARRGRRYVPLAVMPLPVHLTDPGDVPLAWVRGVTLEGEDIWVPAHEVLCPFTAPAGCANPPVWHSAGIASGSHLTECVFHGLLEVIERDAVAVAELGGVGTSVDLDGFASAPVQALRARLAGSGLRLEVKQLSAVGGVHAYAAFIEDPLSANPLRLNGGHSAHTDPFLALEDAILEAVQSRAVLIAGAREDLDGLDRFAALGYDGARAALAWWLTPTPEAAPAPAAPLPRPHDLAPVLRDLRETLRGQGFWPVVTVELSPPGAAIVVARVILPTCSHAAPGNIRLGRRIRVTAPV